MTPHVNGHNLTPMELANLARSWMDTYYDTRDVHAWRTAISIYKTIDEQHQEAVRLNLGSADYIGMVAYDLYFDLYPWA
jgi:hypothetical protein